MMWQRILSSEREKTQRSLKTQEEEVYQDPPKTQPRTLMAATNTSQRRPLFLRTLEATDIFSQRVPSSWLLETMRCTCRLVQLRTTTTRPSGRCECEVGRKSLLMVDKLHYRVRLGGWEDAGCTRDHCVEQGERRAASAISVRIWR